MGGIVSKEWSGVQFSLTFDETKNQGAKAIISGDSLHVVTKKGRYYRANLKEENGQLKSE